VTVVIEVDRLSKRFGPVTAVDAWGPPAAGHWAAGPGDAGQRDRPAGQLDRARDLAEPGQRDEDGGRGDQSRRNRW